MRRKGGDVLKGVWQFLYPLLVATRVAFDMEFSYKMIFETT